jgi:FMN phosphatase YigB (HAD superfamily)
MDHEALRCVTAVHELGIRVAICSNTNAEHWRHLSQAHPELAAPHIKRFLSFEMGKVKSEREFFSQIVDDTKCPFEHHLLIDDLGINIGTARGAGMRVAATKGPARLGELSRILSEQYWV